MKMRITAFPGLVALTLALSPSAWATPAQILIIRHAEKPATGIDLSPEGYEHAQKLVTYFESNPEVTQYGTPAAIFAMTSSGEDESRRPLETVTPLATALGIKIHEKFGKDDLNALSQKIMSDASLDGKMVLICWEHHVIPDLARGLGAKDAPDSWNNDDFTSVWELDFEGDKVAGFRIFKQQL